jgi:hypothetical protein
MPRPRPRPTSTYRTFCSQVCGWGAEEAEEEERAEVEEAGEEEEAEEAEVESAVLSKCGDRRRGGVD